MKKFVFYKKEADGSYFSLPSYSTQARNKSEARQKFRSYAKEINKRATKRIAFSRYHCDVERTDHPF